MIRIPCLAFALALALAPVSFAGETETIEFEKLSHTQRTTISRAGASVMEGIADARVSLERKDGARARQALGAVAEQLRLIRDASPAASLGNATNTLHAQLVKGESDAQHLAPIYTRLDAYQDVVGVDVAEEVRVHLESAKGKLSAGETEEAAVDLEAVSESIRYVEIDLPVKQTLARVDRAITQIGSKDLLGADANLREAQGSLQTFGEMASIQAESETEAVGTGPE